MVGRRIGVFALALGIGLSGALLSAEGSFATNSSKPDFSKLKKIPEPSPCKNDPGITDSTIKVGVLTITSGPQAQSFAPSTMNGIQARVDAANASGELGKRKIQLVVQDTQGDTARNLTSAQKLVEQDKVFGIIEQDNSAGGQRQVPQPEEDPCRRMAHRRQGVGHLPQHVLVAEHTAARPGHRRSRPVTPTF